MKTIFAESAFQRIPAKQDHPVQAAVSVLCFGPLTDANKRGNQQEACWQRSLKGLDMLGNMIGEPAPVVVREPEALAPKPGSEHTVLLSQVINHILLLAVDPVLCQNSALLK